MSESTFVSVIVPTYKDTERLKKCLDCLFMQSYPQNNYEVIVVNNDPDHHLGSDFLNGLSGHETVNILMLDEPKPGSYAARNAGIQRARGSIIAFTDSDCMPRRDWLEQGVLALQTAPNFYRVSGPVEIFKEAGGGWLAWKFDSVSAFHQRYSAVNGRSVTANLFVTAELLYRVGLFDDRLRSGGDIQWADRAQKKGYRLLFCESAIVKHPARRDLAGLISKKRRIAGGAIQRIDRVSRKLMYMISLLAPPLKPARLWVIEKKGLPSIALVFPLYWYMKMIMFFEAFRVFLGKEAER